MREKDYKLWMASVSERCKNKENLDRVMIELNDALNENPDNPEVLFFIGYILVQSEKLGFAYHIFKRLVELSPQKWEVWNNLARCSVIKSGTREPLEYLQTAAAMNPNSTAILLNTAVAFLNLGNGEKSAQASMKALEIDAGCDKARDNLGTALLSQRQWEKGFLLHDASLGGKHRTKHVYNNCPDWDGEPRDGDVVFYGEQGLGDEILYASCLPDAIKKVGNGAILNVDNRLQGLFRRSFPDAKAVYGDRLTYQKQLWPQEHTIVAQASLGQLPKFFRKRDADFFGAAYLAPDPMRVTAYEAMLLRHIQNRTARPCIGLAWQGGKVHTRERRERSMTLNHFKPLIDPEVSGIDADWFILEYGLVADEINDFLQENPGLTERVHYFPWILQSRDYDDTAALVSLMHSVVAVPTTVIHLAGGLGVDTHVILPIVPQWRFGFNAEWTDFPWHSSVALHRTPPGVNKAEMILRFIPDFRAALSAKFSGMENREGAQQ